MPEFPKPYDAAITRYFETEAPKAIRKAIKRAGRDDVLSESYPYREELDRDDYTAAHDQLQIELVRLQTWVRETGARVAVIFEGRDAAGKGGAIQAITENLNPRGARVVALPKPSDVERGQWYFQRYVAHLPSAGEIVLFDRSWYNRAVVEPVFGFCTEAETAHFFAQVPEFEAMLVEDGIQLIKIWLTLGRAEQLRRFLDREKDPLKQWKVSPIDVGALEKWEAYAEAITEMFGKTHFAACPWTVIRADDKKRARLEVIRHILGRLPYAGRDARAIGEPDPRLTGGPEILPDENR